MITVFNDRDNVTRLELLEDGELVPEHAAKRAVLRFPASSSPTGDEVCLDTDVDAEIELTDNATVLELRLGQQSQTLRPGLHRAKLTIYDNPHPNGIAWEELLVDVVGWSTC